MYERAGAQSSEKTTSIEKSTLLYLEGHCLVATSVVFTEKNRKIFHILSRYYAMTSAFSHGCNGVGDLVGCPEMFSGDVRWVLDILIGIYNEQKGT